MRIIPASSEAQIAEIRKLFADFIASLPFDTKYHTFKEEVTTFPGEFGPPTGCLLLAVDDKEIAYGCASLRAVDKKTGELQRLFVKPESRRQGIGRQLAAAILETARARNYARLVVELAPHMKEAIDLMESLGMEPTKAYRPKPAAGMLFYELLLRQ